MDRWKILITICCCSILLAACGNESAAKKAVRSNLKDPDSAKFGDFSKYGDMACLTVNARNSMGGYVGDREARLKKTDGVWNVLEIAEISHERCSGSIKSTWELCETLKKRLSDAESTTTQQIYDQECK